MTLSNNILFLKKNQILTAVGTSAKEAIPLTQVKMTVGLKRLLKVEGVN